MRWDIEKRSKPYHGKQRVITRFAFLPVKAETGEIRWLEKVSIMQTYLIDPNGHWINDYFLEL